MGDLEASRFVLSLRQAVVPFGKCAYGKPTTDRELGRERLMNPPRKSNPRAEHRLQQNQRAKDSVSLAAKFPRLGSLTVHLAYFDAQALNRTSEVKYQVNLDHAKSFFCFVCPSAECVGGDFDLSEELARAVSEGRKLTTGELRCPGWHKRSKIDRAPCQARLRYTLNLRYSRA